MWWKLPPGRLPSKEAPRMNLFTAAETVANYANAGAAKTKLSVAKMLLLGILAGMEHTDNQIRLFLLTDNLHPFAGSLLHIVETQPFPQIL